MKFDAMATRAVELIAHGKDGKNTGSGGELSVPVIE
jgi:hypothetical protein